MNKVIINADDFGLTETCTKAIYRAYCERLITDTTIVSNGIAYDLAVQIIKKNPSFGENIGIHLNLSEGKPLTKEIRSSKFTTNGLFNGYFKNNKTNLIPLQGKEKQMIHNELSAQIEKVLDSGIIITHIDSHHHVHTNYSLAKEIVKLSKEFHIDKVRIRKNLKKLGLTKKVMYELYNFYLRYNKRKTVDWFGNIYEYTKEKKGISEIMVHPDFSQDGELIDRDKVKMNNGLRICLGKNLYEEYDTYIKDKKWIKCSYKRLFND